AKPENLKRFCRLPSSTSFAGVMFGSPSRACWRLPRYRLKMGLDRPFHRLEPNTMRLKEICCIVALFGLSVPGGVSAAPPTEKDVLEAIKMGKEYLASVQKESGKWSSEVGVRYEKGTTALVLLALMNSGMTSADEPVAKGLNYLRSLPSDEPNTTY